MYELTNPQKSIWLTEQYFQNTTINNICVSSIIDENLDFNLLKKSEQNLNELISEILLSSEVREALKNDIQCFNEKYNFEDDYEKNKQLCLTQKFHVHAREDFLDEDEIALFLKAGLDINTWGVKNRFRYAYFKEKGVNIVIANKNFKKLKM